jgi:glycosyltransferase involved in cell wall biosynthesis
MRAVIWKSTLLPGSETFIRNQMSSVRRWEVQAVGAKRVSSPLASDDDVIVYSGGFAERVRAALFVRSGYSGRVTRSIASAGAQLIHAHFANEGMQVSRIARRLGLPLVVTLHGYDVTSEPQKAGIAGVVYRAKLRRLFSEAAALVAVSEHIACRAIDLGADPAKVVVARIGVPIPAAEPQPGIERAILAVGRLTEKKGFEYLIRAAAQYRRELRGVPVTIVGDGPLRPELTKLAAELGADIQFLGAQPPQIVRDLMSRRPVVCIPSVKAANGDEEGLPTVVMEAMALGCPVVATAHSGLVEAVVDGSTGVLVAERDVDALGAALARLVSDATVSEQFGDAGRTRAKAEFDILTQTRELEGIYDRAVAASLRR